MRETLGFLLLVLLAAVSLLNIRASDRLCNEIQLELSRSETAALDGDWDGAVRSFNAALDEWLASEKYRDIFIRHSESDSCSDAFRELNEALLSESGKEIQALYRKLQQHVQSIAKMEKLRLGNIL